MDTVRKIYIKREGEGNMRNNMICLSISIYSSEIKLYVEKMNSKRDNRDRKLMFLLFFFVKFHPPPHHHHHVARPARLTLITYNVKFSYCIYYTYLIFLRYHG